MMDNDGYKWYIIGIYIYTIGYIYNIGYIYIYGPFIWICGILKMGIYGIQWDRTKQQYELGG